MIGESYNLRFPVSNRRKNHSFQTEMDTCGRGLNNYDVKLPNATWRTGEQRSRIQPQENSPTFDKVRDAK